MEMFLYFSEKTEVKFRAISLLDKMVIPTNYETQNGYYGTQEKVNGSEKNIWINTLSV